MRRQPSSSPLLPCTINNATRHHSIVRPLRVLLGQFAPVHSSHSDSGVPLVSGMETCTAEDLHTCQAHRKVAQPGHCSCMSLATCGPAELQLAPSGLLCMQPTCPSAHLHVCMYMHTACLPLLTVPSRANVDFPTLKIRVGFPNLPVTPPGHRGKQYDSHFV